MKQRAQGLQLGAYGRRAETASRGVQIGVRMYLPELARFASDDPIVAILGFGQTAARSTYARSNPLNVYDMAGRSGRLAMLPPGTCMSPVLLFDDRAREAYDKTGDSEPPGCFTRHTLSLFRVLSVSWNSGGGGFHPGVGGAVGLGSPDYTTRVMCEDPGGAGIEPLSAFSCGLGDEEWIGTGLDPGTGFETGFDGRHGTRCWGLGLSLFGIEGQL